MLRPQSERVHRLRGQRIDQPKCQHISSNSKPDNRSHTESFHVKSHHYADRQLHRGKRLHFVDDSHQPALPTTPSTGTPNFSLKQNPAKLSTFAPTTIKPTISPTQNPARLSTSAPTPLPIPHPTDAISVATPSHPPATSKFLVRTKPSG